MINKEEYEKICFEIISAAGTAKSCYLEAIENAKDNLETKALIEEGNQAFLMATTAHQKALQMEAKEGFDVGVLLVHAETILSSAETIRDLSGTIIMLLDNK